MVDRFDESVGQAVFDRGEDRGLVFDDAPLQVYSWPLWLIETSLTLFWLVWTRDTAKVPVS